MSQPSLNMSATRRPLLKTLALGAAAFAMTMATTSWADTPMTLKPHRAEAVRLSIGVNTHLNYMDGSYANLPFVIDSLDYLGITHVRDLTPTPWFGGSAPLISYEKVMNAGIRFTFMDYTGSLDPAVMLGNLEALEKRVPGGVAAIEGFNEVDHNPVKYKGLEGLPAAKAYQKDLSLAVKAHPLLKDKPVFDFTGHDVAAPAPADKIDQRADYLNFHTYAQNGTPPRFWFSGATDAIRSYQMPGVMTEFGYATMPQSGWLVIGVDERAQAKGTLNGIFDSLDLGFSRLYLYELVDQKPDPFNKNLEMHFGLFDNKFRKKAAARAVHNLTKVLKDTGVQALSFETRPLRFDLGELPKSANALAFEKASGATYLVLWNEAPMWDRATGKPVVSSALQVRLSLRDGAVATAIIDPLNDKTPRQALKPATKLTIQLPDHPVLVEIRR